MDSEIVASDVHIIPEPAVEQHSLSVNDVLKAEKAQDPSDSDGEDRPKISEEIKDVEVPDKETQENTKDCENLSYSASRHPSSKSAIHFPCEICGLTFNSQQQAEAHFQGKKHRAKAERSGIIVITEESINVERKQGKSRGKGESNIVCNLCEKSFFMSEDAIEHFKEEVHRMNEEAAIETKHAQDLGSMSAMNLNKQLSCNLCQVSFNSVSQVYAHFIGRKHKAKEASGSQTMDNTPHDFNQPGNTGRKRAAPVNVSMPTMKQDSKKRVFEGMQVNATASGIVTPVTAPQDFYCNFCNITVNSKTQLERHCNGIKHKLQTGELQEAPDWWIEREKQRSGKDKVQKGKLLKCEICNITVNSEDQLAVHLKGRTHQNRLLGRVPPQGTGLTVSGADSYLATGGTRESKYLSKPDSNFAVPNSAFGLSGIGRNQNSFRGPSWSVSTRPPPAAPSLPRPPRPPMPQAPRLRSPVPPHNKAAFGSSGSGTFVRPMDSVLHHQVESGFLVDPDSQTGLPQPPLPLFPPSAPQSFIPGRTLPGGRGRGASNSAIQQGRMIDRRM